MGYLREARSEDADLLFQWANERTVRENAFSTAEITYDEHIKWFQNVLIRKDIKQYIYLFNDEPIGQIRVDVNKEEAVVSYSICLEKRCMGYGKEMAGLLKDHVKRDFPQVKKLIAKVKPDNLASQKVFIDNGYQHKYNVYELDIEQDNPKSEQINNCSGGGIASYK